MYPLSQLDERSAAIVPFRADVTKVWPNPAPNGNGCRCGGRAGGIVRRNQTEEPAWTAGRITAGVIGVILSLAIPVGLWAWGYWAGKRAK